MSTDVTLKHGFSLNTNIREKLTSLERGMNEGIADGSLTEQKVELTEFYASGCYGRQIFLPKDTALVGEIHKDEWIHIVSRGKIRIVTEEGTHIVDATERPQTFISPAGIKRAGFVLEDTWWTSFIATDAKTDKEVRKQHIVSDYAELEHKEVEHGR